jgi:hypothetical protein
MQRYLRLPLSCIRDVVGKNSPGSSGGRKAQTLAIDAYGDCFLAGYSAPDDYGWGLLHNSLRDALHACARHAGIAASVEQGKRTREDGSASNCRPGDVKLPGAHGYQPAHGRVILADIVVANAVCKTYREKGAAKVGAAAAIAATAKHNKVNRLQSVSKDDYFVPIAFESEGYAVNALQSLLFGLAKHRMFHDGLAEDSHLTHRLHGQYMDAMAQAHARGLARCILDRGMSSYNAHAGYNRTFHLSDLSSRSSSSSSSDSDSPAPRNKRRRTGARSGALQQPAT